MQKLSARERLAIHGEPKVEQAVKWQRALTVVTEALVCIWALGQIVGWFT